MKENFCILIKISLKFVHRGRIDNNPSTSHYLNQCWPDSLTHICDIRGRWVQITQIKSDSRTAQHTEYKYDINTVGPISLTYRHRPLVTEYCGVDHGPNWFNWCLTWPDHKLNQCCPIINDILDNLSQFISVKMPPTSLVKNFVKITFLQLNSCIKRPNTLQFTVCDTITILYQRDSQSICDSSLKCKNS